MLYLYDTEFVFSALSLDWEYILGASFIDPNVYLIRFDLTPLPLLWCAGDFVGKQPNLGLGIAFMRYPGLRDRADAQGFGTFLLELVR